MRLQHEVFNGPESQKWTKKVMAGVDAMASAKKMIQPLIAYQKKFDGKKLSELYQASEKLRNYFESTGKTFAPKLRVIFWRAAFAEMAMVSSLEKSAAKLLEDEDMLIADCGEDMNQVHTLASDCIATAVNNWLENEDTQKKNNEVGLLCRLASRATRLARAVPDSESCRGQCGIESIGCLAGVPASQSEQNANRECGSNDLAGCEVTNPNCQPVEHRSCVAAFANSCTTKVIRDELLHRVTIYMETMGKMKSSGKFVEVLSDAKVVLEAALPETKIKPGQLMGAKARLSEESCAAKIWHGWFESSSGTVILADADMLLAASALDDQCLEDYLMCEKVMDEEGMPKRNEHGFIEGLFDMVVNGHTTALMSDSGKQLVMAMKSWSAMGAEEYMPRVATSITRLTDCIYFVDAACSQKFATTWGACLTMWDDAFTDMPSDKPLPLVPENMAIHARGIDFEGTEKVEDALVAAASTTIAGLEDTLRGRSEETERALSQMREALNTFKHNQLCRDHLRSDGVDKASIVAEAFDALPFDFKDMIDEYRASSQNSLIGKLMQIWQGKRVAPDCADFSLYDNVEVVVQGEGRRQ